MEELNTSLPAEMPAEDSRHPLLRFLEQIGMLERGEDLQPTPRRTEDMAAAQHARHMTGPF